MIKKIAGIIVNAFKSGNKLLVCGNGGSAAEAQHLAGELICKYMNQRRPLPAISLSTDTSVLTAIANDFGYENVFSRQIDALGKPGDVLLTMTTSGSSPNILNAEEMALRKEMQVVRLPNDGEITPRIQEGHLKMIHKLCFYIEREIRRKEL